MAVDVLGVGCVAVDDLLYVAEYPGPDAKMPIQRTERQCGGLTLTALVAAAKLGGSCGFAGLLGRDELSCAVLECFRAAGVDVSRAVFCEEAGPFHSMIVVSEATGSRNIFYRATGAVGAADSLPEASVIEGCKVLFVDHVGVPGAVRPARVARAAGIPVVGDLEDDSHPRFGELLESVNHLVVSLAFALRLTGCAAVEEAVLALRAGREGVVATCGAEGAWYWSGGKDAVRHQPAFEVAAVDTTGCGDVFHGAYALGLARGMEMRERVRFASAAAALKATRRGGPGGAPTREELDRFLEGRR